MAVEITDATGRLSTGELHWLRAHAREAARLSGTPGTGGEVRVRVIGDAEMDAAHRRHLNIAGTTDVLTFDLRDDPRLPELDVDILVCFDEAERQGRDRGLPTARELLLYIVHGMLHCLGHDDTTPDAAAAMHRREDEILAAMGVGATYASPEQGTRSAASQAPCAGAGAAS